MHRRGWCLIDVTAAAARWLELAGVPRGMPGRKVHRSGHLR